MADAGPMGDSGGAGERGYVPPLEGSAGGRRGAGTKQEPPPTPPPPGGLGIRSDNAGGGGAAVTGVMISMRFDRLRNIQSA